MSHDKSKDENDSVKLQEAKQKEKNNKWYSFSRINKD